MGRGSACLRADVGGVSLFRCCTMKQDSRHGMSSATMVINPPSADEDEGSILSFGDGPAYWDKRYQQDPNPYECIETFSRLKPIIEDVTQCDTKKQILHVGCGNSLLPEEMFDAGYHSIVNVDSSAVAIELMKSRNKFRDGMTWEVADCT